MDLHSDYPFWMIKEGIVNNFPSLHRDLKTDVAVIGGGISGALIANTLCKEGLKVAVLEKRHVAHGSTSASTAMLQYEIDTPLFKLMEMKGKKDAIRAYRLCGEAIETLEKMCGKIPGKAEFQSRPSLLFASFQKHVPEILEPEFEARKAAGFKVRMLSETEIAKKYGFSAPAGIFSEEGAHVNPYLLTNHLLKKVTNMGGIVCDLTEVESWTPSKNKVMLHAKNGLNIEAKYVVVACGYEAQNYLEKKVTRLHSSYAIVSKPLLAKTHWHENSLIWETKTPYLYLRTTGDNRIMAGGRDEMFYSPDKRDALLARKRSELEKDFKKLFPKIPFETDFAWAGTFAETEDGLPYIGRYDQKRVLFAMGYGGNGITFSVVAADILRDVILGKKNKDARLFAFERT